MDTKTGRIYRDLSEAEQDILRGMLEMRDPPPPHKARQRIRARLITGPKPTLRKLQRMIRKQLRHEAERKQKGEGARDGR